jgi:hypothetical protein
VAIKTKAARVAIRFSEKKNNLKPQPKMGMNSICGHFPQLKIAQKKQPKKTVSLPTKGRLLSEFVPKEGSLGCGGHFACC